MNLKPIAIAGALLLAASCAPGAIRQSLDDANKRFTPAYDSQFITRRLIQEKVKYALREDTAIEGDCRTHAVLALSLVKQRGYDGEILVIRTRNAKLHAVVAVADGHKVWILDLHYPWPIRLKEHPGEIVKAYD